MRIDQISRLLALVLYSYGTILFAVESFMGTATTEMSVTWFIGASIYHHVSARDNK